MEDLNRSNARLKKLLHIGKSQRNRTRPSNPDSYGGPPYPALSPSSFGHNFEPQDDDMEAAVADKRWSFASFQGLRGGEDASSAFSKRRTGFKSLYETANNHCISLFQQLELCKADYTATDHQLQKEREHAYLLNQRLEAATDAQRQIIADREIQEKIAIGLSNELEIERLRLSEARAQLASLNREKGEAQRKYTELKDVYRSQKVAIAETTAVVNELQEKLAGSQKQLDGMRLLEDELTKMQSESAAGKRERHQLRKQVDRNESQVADLQEQLAYAKSHLTSLEDEKARVNHALADALESRQNIEKNFQQAGQALQQTLQRSSDAQSILERQLEEVRRDYNETNQRAEELATQLIDARDISSDLQSRLQQAEVALADSQHLVDTLQGHITELRSRNVTLENDLESLRAQTDLTTSSHLDRIAALETELKMSRSAHEATASARDSAVAQLENLSEKNLNVARQLQDFETSSHQLRMDLDEAKVAGTQMHNHIVILQSTLHQLEHTRDEIAGKAADAAVKYEAEICDLQQQLERAEQETKNTRGTTVQKLEELKQINEQLSARLLDLKETRNQHTSDMRSRVADLTARVQAAAGLHDRMVLEKQTLEESIAELKATVDVQASNLTQAQRDVTLVQVELETARQDLRTVTEDRDDIRQQFAAQSESMRETDQAVRSLRSALGIARSTCHCLQDQLKQVVEHAMNEKLKRKQVELENHRLRNRENQLVADLQQIPTLQNQNQTLQDALRSIEGQLEGSSRCIKELSDELASSRDALAVARAEVDANQEALKKSRQNAERVQHLESECSTLSGLVSKLETTNAELKGELEQRQVEREELHRARARLREQDAALQDLEDNIRQARASLADAQVDQDRERSERSRIGNELFIVENERDELTKQINLFKERLRSLEDQLRRAESGADYANLLSVSRRILRCCEALSDGHSPSRPYSRRSPVSPGTSRAALTELNNNLDLIFKYMNFFEVDTLRKQRGYEGRLPSSASSAGSGEPSLEPSTPRMPPRGSEHSYFNNSMVPPLSPPTGKGYGGGWNPLLTPFSPLAGSSKDMQGFGQPPQGWGYGHTWMTGTRPS